MADQPDGIKNENDVAMGKAHDEKRTGASGRADVEGLHWSEVLTGSTFGPRPEA